MAVEQHTLGHGLQGGIERGQAVGTERARVAHHGVVLHGVAPGEHLEVVVGQLLAGSVAGVEGSAEAQSDDESFGGVCLQVVIVGQHFLHFERQLGLRHGTVAVGRAPLHNLVVAGGENPHPASPNEGEEHIDLILGYISLQII